MYNISIGDGGRSFITFPILTIDDLAVVMTESIWSPSSFKDNERSKNNFISADVIGLDIDEGLTLDEAIKLFAPFKHIIGTTKSHQIEKNGKVNDRFRVVLFLEEQATNIARFEATARKLISTYKTDEQCKDASRMFYPCKDIISVNREGLTIPLEQAEVVMPKVREALSTEQKGKLARSTLEFLVSGAPAGMWNAALFKAAKDWQEQGYDEVEFIERAELITGHLDNTDLTTIESAFKNPPKYEPRVEVDEPLIVTSGELATSLVNYLSDKDLVKGQPTYLAGLDGLLAGKRLGEVTALCAEGKTGKNALWHFLQYLWLEAGVKFGYASRELDPDTEVLPDYLSMKLDKNIRLAPIDDNIAAKYNAQLLEWNIPFAGGRGHFPIDRLEQWISAMKTMGVEYLFLDHLHWMCSDPEDYKEASNLSRMLKLFARKYQVHIDVIIQPKVLMEGQKPSLTSMKGGSAIGQNIDNFFTLERVMGQKNISKLSLKAKRSRLAQTGEIYLEYNPSSLKFEEVELQKDELSTYSGNVVGFDKQVF